MIRALDGDMNGRLLARHDVKGDNEENRRIGEQELARCKAMASKPVKYCAWAIWRAAITSSSLPPVLPKAICWKALAAKAISRLPKTLLIRGKSRTIRRIQSIHYLDRKDPEMQVHIL